MIKSILNKLEFDIHFTFKKAKKWQELAAADTDITVSA